MHTNQATIVLLRDRRLLVLAVQQDNACSGTTLKGVDGVVKVRLANLGDFSRVYMSLIWSTINLVQISSCLFQCVRSFQTYTCLFPCHFASSVLNFHANLLTFLDNKIWSHLLKACIFRCIWLEGKTHVRINGTNAVLAFERIFFV